MPTERQPHRLQVLHSEEALQSRASSTFRRRQMAIDIHRGLGRVDGSWVDRYKVREEVAGSQPPLFCQPLGPASAGIPL